MTSPEGKSARQKRTRRDGRNAFDPAKRKTLKKLAALGLVAFSPPIFLSSCNRRGALRRPDRLRLILLGIDGLDPGLAAHFMEQDKLPNLSRLRQMGGFRKLRSTIPPVSPPAWATVITGLDPGGHGIYDFYHRDPRTYSLRYATTHTAPPDLALPTGRWAIPLTQSKIELLRRGRAFWEVLEEVGVPCEIHRVPSNFPPHDSGSRQLAGLGVPDIRGTIGQFSYFTDDPNEAARTPGTQLVQIDRGGVKALLKGPINSLEKGLPELSVPLEIWVDQGNHTCKIKIQDQFVLLRQGEWSDWTPVTFVLVPHIKAVTGICRFYVKELSPHFRLYTTPLNLDPLAPALPISTPPSFAAELAQETGRFHTLGLPEDTSGLLSGVLSDEEYLVQTAHIMGEARRIYERALDAFFEGILFYCFGTTDRNQHMFWRCLDPRHPAYNPTDARKHGHVVEECYRIADELVGTALQACDADTRLLVFSDHGFAPYYRHLNINTWLAENGLLSVREQREGATLSHDVDWDHTTAYSLGFSSLYLNIRGREARGTVLMSDRLAVATRVAEALSGVRDPSTGESVISAVHLPEKVYSGSVPEVAPDLVVGCTPGYRCSFASVAGTLASAVIEDNTSKWSGDHVFDCDFVPGLLLSSHPILAEHPDLRDLPVTAIEAFGLQTPREMTGSSLW